MTWTGGAGLVAPSDIAELAGVTRGAVSNWRKRQNDFPKQVGGTSTKPLFSSAEVTAWLTGRGYAVKRDDGQSSLWSAMNKLRGSLRPETMTDLVASLACARKMAAESPEDTTWNDVRAAAASDDPGRLDDVVRRVAWSSPRNARLVHFSTEALSVGALQIAPLVDAIDSIEVNGLTGVIDYVLGRTATASIRSGGEYGFVGSRISTLLGRLAAADKADVVYDPACGVAAALTASLDAGARPRRIVGHEINEHALRTAAQRLYLRGVDADLLQTNVLIGDTDPTLRADVVIAEPPFGLRWDAAEALTDPRWRFGMPPRSAADLAWVQHAIVHLTQDGRAYVVIPMGALVRGGREQSIRTELVRQGCIHAVIGLPGKMLPHVSIPLAVWVLVSPDSPQRTDEVLFVDASEEAEPETAVAQWLTFRSGATPDGPAHKLVPITDVLAGDANLSPRRWTIDPQLDPAEVARRYADGWAGMTATVEKLTSTLKTLTAMPAVSAPVVVSVGELVDQGVLEIKAGRHRDREDLPELVAERLVTVGTVRRGELPEVGPPGDRLRDEFALTVGGGVLVSMTNGVRAVPDANEGGYLLSTGVSEMRILNQNIVSAGYLALMLTGAWNNRFQAGTTVPRSLIKDLEVPLVPMADQDTISVGGFILDTVRRTAYQLAEEASAVSTALLDAVRFDAPLDLAGKASSHDLRPATSPMKGST